MSYEVHKVGNIFPLCFISISWTDNRIENYTLLFTIMADFLLLFPLAVSHSFNTIFASPPSWHLWDKFLGQCLRSSLSGDVCNLQTDCKGCFRLLMTITYLISVIFSWTFINLSQTAFAVFFGWSLVNRGEATGKKPDIRFSNTVFIDRNAHF